MKYIKTCAIVIPCRNEEKYIAKCLESIINNDYPKDKLEVFVCDGMSNDQTQSIVDEFTKKYSFIKLLLNKNKTTPHALNLGITNTLADVIIILGAHAEIYPDYVSQSIDKMSISQDMGCVGGILYNTPENKKSAIVSKAMSSGFGVGNAHFRTGNKEGYVDTVAFGAYKKEVFESIGLFDINLARNQDDEFNYRLLKNGFKIYLSKDIKAKYYVRSSFKNLFKQYFQYGYWKVYVNKKHAAITTVRQLVPLFFVLMLISGGIGSVLSLFILKAFISILSFYFILSFISAFKQSKNIVEISLIMYTFLLLHTSYGLGYLQGIIHFFILRKNSNENYISLSR
ncbi:MAG: glycosyltransferase family 2 protein [Candidatus Sericytochromatia bacterium]|nr:glycosyltransferase family 2 protein [Candidatus Sericytochromatia bacterium]